VALKVVRPESDMDFGTGARGSTPAVTYRDVLRTMSQESSMLERVGKHPCIVRLLAVARNRSILVLEFCLP